MPKLTKKIIFIYLLILVALYLVIAVIPSLTGALTRTEVIEYGELKVSDKVKCYIVRDETVYAASENGTMKFSAEEGQQVKRGTKVLAFTEESNTSKNTKSKDKTENSSKYEGIVDSLGDSIVPDSSYVSQRKGTFSFYIDGYENYFTPKNMKSLSQTKISEMTTQPKNVKRKTAVKGDPIYKISDNSKWYIACWIEETDVSKYEIGNSVTVELPKGDVKATINNIIEDGNQWLLILKTNRYYEGYTNIREAEGSLVTTDQEGLLISNRCITTKKNKVGVYVKNTSGDYNFKPIQALATDGKKTLVSEGTYYNDKGESVDTVEGYDEVLKNPDSDKEGK